MLYERYCEHISATCPCCLRCPFMCDSDVLYTREELENHITVCPNAIVTCPKCDMEITNKELPDHDCIEHLKNVIFQKNLVIEKLEQENDFLKNGHHMNSENQNGGISNVIPP